MINTFNTQIPSYYKFIIVPQYKNSEIIRLLTNDVKEQCSTNLSSNERYYLKDLMII